MQGNLNHEYQLRLDRVRRLQEGYAAGRLTRYQFQKMMEQEGYGIDYDDLGTFRTIGKVTADIVERLKP